MTPTPDLFPKSTVSVHLVATPFGLVIATKCDSCPGSCFLRLCLIIAPRLLWGTSLGGQPKLAKPGGQVGDPRNADRVNSILSRAPEEMRCFLRGVEIRVGTEAGTKEAGYYTALDPNRVQVVDLTRGVDRSRLGLGSELELEADSLPVIFHELAHLIHYRSYSLGEQEWLGMGEFMEFFAKMWLDPGNADTLLKPGWSGSLFYR